MTSLVQLNGDQLTCTVSSLGEAKFAIKEIKLLKKGLSLKKREVTTAMKAVRFRYAQEVRSRGSMMRGGGGFGRFVRAVQSASRDSKRAGLALELHPLEMEKVRLEGIAHAADEMLIKLELYIHEQA